MNRLTSSVLFTCLVACGPPPTDPRTPTAVEAADPADPDPPAVDIATVRTTTRTVESWDGYQSLVPFQHWSELDGRVVGVLMAVGTQPWGVSMHWGRVFETAVQSAEYRFFRDRASAQAVYFQSDGRGNNFIPSWGVPLPGGGVEKFDAAMFEPTTANEWGLHALAHLVEVEVNGGRGGRGIHFVITDARVLDRSAGYPIDLEATLTGLRRRFDLTLGSYGAEVARLLEIGRAGAAGKEVDEPGVAHVAVWPTWVPRERTLEVLFVVSFAETAFGPPTEKVAPCPRCPCTREGICAPCIPCDTRKKIVRSEARYGYQAAVLYTVDRAGSLVSEVVYAPRAL